MHGHLHGGTPPGSMYSYICTWVKVDPRETSFWDFPCNASCFPCHGCPCGERYMGISVCHVGLPTVRVTGLSMRKLLLLFICGTSHIMRLNSHGTHTTGFPIVRRASHGISHTGIFHGIPNDNMGIPTGSKVDPVRVVISDISYRVSYGVHAISHKTFVPREGPWKGPYCPIESPMDTHGNSGGAGRARGCAKCSRGRQA